MYLTKCLLKSRRPLNPYEIHRKIWSLFPDRPQADRDFLFRVEKSSQGRGMILLQSAHAPIHENAEKIILLDQKELCYSFKTGMGLRFLLTANPTKRIRDIGGKSGNQGKCRVPLTDDDEIKAWLLRRMSDAAQVHEVLLAQKEVLYFRKQGRSGKVATVTYSGLLSVADSDRFYDLVEKGIGPAKAFGCGLLSLAQM